MGERLSDAELLRDLVRSMDRLKELVLTPSSEDDWKDRLTWVGWHDLLVKEAQRRGLLPHVQVTVRTELGQKVGAF